MSYLINSIFLQTIFQNIIVPILVGAITYFLFRKLDEWKKRKEQSKLGVAIIDSLIEEVQSGIKIMTLTQDPKTHSSNPLPIKSWNGMTTISDDILLRILEVSGNVKAESFPLNEIRTHCKNYFDHMSASWENAITDTFVVDWKDNSNKLIHEGKFIEAAENVCIMLKQIRNLLNTNSKKIFPK